VCRRTVSAPPVVLARSTGHAEAIGGAAQLTRRSLSEIRFPPAPRSGAVQRPRPNARAHYDCSVSRTNHFQIAG
jgi:hypothetical protein